MKIKEHYPVSDDVRSLFGMSALTIEAFSEKNNLPHKVLSVDVLEDHKWKDASAWYQQNKITLLPKRLARPATEKQVRLWSFPGSKVDRTPYGVLAHEFGHFVDEVLGYPSRHGFWSKKTNPVSGYEPNNSERFAESMRLFILNPCLLRWGSPQRYAEFLSHGMKPVMSVDSYEENLCVGCPERIKKSLDRWIS